MQSGLKIPGYSGHIPLKLDVVGQTTGETNRQAGENFRYTVRRPGMGDTGAAILRDSVAHQMRSTSVDGSAEKPEKARRQDTSGTDRRHQGRNQGSPKDKNYIVDGIFGDFVPHNPLGPLNATKVEAIVLLE